jgi:hypothetical protein
MNHHSGINQTFSLDRWTKLLLFHWTVNRKRYLLALPAMAGLLLVWESFILIMNAFQPLNEGFQGITYYVGLFIVGCLYASMTFAESGIRAQGITWLATPASALEKLLCGLLYSAIAFFVVYNLIFYLVDIPMVRIANGLIENGHRTWPGGLPINPVSIFNVYNGMPHDPVERSSHLYVLFYFALQSAFALGSIYFDRYAFVKTGVAVVIAMGCFMILQDRLIEPTLPSGWHRVNFYDWIVDADTLRARGVRLSPVLGAVLGAMLIYGIPVLCWTATYFRIKEKQV